MTRTLSLKCGRAYPPRTPPPIIRVGAKRPAVTFREVATDRLAILVCDMWDTHSCPVLAEGTAALAFHIDAFLTRQVLREIGRFYPVVDSWDVIGRNRS